MRGAGGRLLALRHDVEQEGVHVIVQRLVVQEQLRQQAQRLAVRVRALAVNLPHADRRRPATAAIPTPATPPAAARAVAVDLHAGRRARGAARRVRRQRLALAAVLEAELAHQQRVLRRVLRGVGAVVPGVHFEAPQLDRLNVFDFGFLLVLPLQRLLERG